MPFELGLDLGCRDFNGNKAFRDKRLLILEEEKYSTQKSLSDLSFADCKCHQGDVRKLISEVRNWFSGNGHKNVLGPNLIWNNYNEFQANLYAEKLKLGFTEKDIDRLPITEFMDYIDEFIDCID